MDTDVIVGIDIGDYKVCTLVGELTPDTVLRIIGVGTTPAHGMRRGNVVSVDDLAGSVAAAVERAERTSGFQVHRAQVCVTGTHISSVNNKGVVSITRASHEINQEDIARALESARTVPLSPNREVLHVLPRSYIVDGQEGVADPVGMVGFRLEVEAHIIVGSTAPLQNIKRCLEKAGVQARQMIASPLAAAEAVLTEDEKGMGVVVADIGGGTTGICIYVDGSPWHTAVLPVGGSHITNDLTVGLRLPMPVAEELKVRYGHALSSAVDAQELVDVPGSDRAGVTISRRQECEIIEERAAEIFGMILNEIKKSGHDGLLPGGVVLTGGTAELPGLADLGRAILGLPVRVGTPQGVGGLLDSVSGPAYAASVGLLQWGTGKEEYIDEGSRDSSEPGAFDRLRDSFSTVWTVLRRMFGTGK